MNKSDLIALVAKENGCAVSIAKAVVKVLFSGMSDTLVAGDRIEIRGFGSFAVKEYESYTGRNPRSGTATEVSSKKLPYFKVGKELKRRILEARSVGKLPEVESV